MDTAKKSPGKTLAVLLFIALLVLVIVLDMRRRQAEQKVMELSMQNEQLAGNEAQNRENAKAIVNKVRRLYTIPNDVEPTVATIVDVKQLRARNAFYNKAKNGDHLIVTQDRAILYDPIADKIIDVVPVQIQPPAGSAGSQNPTPANQ
jgi:hypothetical protein